VILKTNKLIDYVIFGEKLTLFLKMVFGFEANIVFLIGSSI